MSVFAYRVRAQVGCSLDFTYFPFDHQECEIVIESCECILSSLSTSTIVSGTGGFHMFHNGIWPKQVIQSKLQSDINYVQMVAPVTKYQSSA